MRLFIAIELPGEIRETLCTIQEKITCDATKLTLVKPENIHLTLKFLGEVKEDMLEKIKSALNTISFRSFTMTLSGIGVFPSEHNARVVWVGLQDNAELQRLHQEIEKRLQPLGFKAEKDFAPHLTICRIRSVKNKDAFIEQIKNVKVEEKSFTVNSIVLMRSMLTAEGPVYKVMEEYKAG